jgi:hypothetical protein
MKKIKKVGSGLGHFVKKIGKRQKQFQSKLRSHHTLYAFLGGVGVIMFWHGLWEGLNVIYESGGALSFLGNPIVSMTIGLAILTFSGLFVLELVGREAQELEDQIDDIHEDIEDVQEDLEDVQEDLSHHGAHH